MGTVPDGKLGLKEKGGRFGENSSRKFLCCLFLLGFFLRRTETNLTWGVRVMHESW